MTDAQYEAKFQEMQKYIPFLQKVIEKLKVNNVQQGDNPRKAQLQKMEMLHDLLTNKAKKLKMETLMKCEGVLIKLHAKIEKNEDSILNNVKLKVSDNPSTSKNHDKDKDVEDLTGPASPPPEIITNEEDQPVVIPTERRCSPIMINKEKSTNFHNKPQQQHHSRQQIPDHRSHHHGVGQQPPPHHSDRHKSDEHFQNIRERVFPNPPHGGQRDSKHNLSNDKQFHNQHHHHHHQNSPKDTRNPNSNQQNPKDFHSPSQHSPIPVVGQHLSASKSNSPATVQRLQTVKVVITEPLPQHIKQQHFASYRLHHPSQPNLKPRETICHSNLKTLPQQSQHHRIEPAREVNEAYSPEELWEEYNETNCKRSTNKNTNTVFSRLGDKVPEKTTPISIPGRYTPIPDVLKSPPLTANDINNLLQESGVDKTPSNVSEVGSRRPPKPEQRLDTQTNSLDYIRKKFAQITKLSSPKSDASVSPSLERPSMEKDSKISSPLPNERVALKFNPHPRQERLLSMSSNDGSECSSNHSRVNDPRLKSKLHTTNPLQKPPDFVPNTNVNVLPSINYKDPRLKLSKPALLPTPATPNLLTTYMQNSGMASSSNSTSSVYGARKDPRISRVPPVTQQHSAYPAAPVRRLSTTQPHYSSEENWDSDPEETTPNKPNPSKIETQVKPRNEEAPITSRIDPRLTSTTIGNRPGLKTVPPPPTKPPVSKPVPAPTQPLPNQKLTKSEKRAIRKNEWQGPKPPADLKKPRPPKSDSEEDWDTEPEDIATNIKPATKCENQPEAQTAIKSLPKPQIQMTNPIPIPPANKSKSDTEEDWDSEPEVTKEKPAINKTTATVTKEPMPQQQFPTNISPRNPPPLISPGHHTISPNLFANPKQRFPNNNAPITTHNISPNPFVILPHPLAAPHLPQTNYYAPPDNNRFSAALNDNSERFKYYEAKKQKPPTPSTYKAFREARERAQAEDAAIKRAVQIEETKKRLAAECLLKQKEAATDAQKVQQPEAETNKKTTELTAQKKPQPQKPIAAVKTNHLKKDTTKSPSAESTLDKMYRTQNFNSKFPKANTTFKIPKKKTEEDYKKEEAKKKAEEDKKVEEAKKKAEEDKLKEDAKKKAEEDKKKEEAQKKKTEEETQKKKIEEEAKKKIEEETQKKTNDLVKITPKQQIPKVTQNQTTEKPDNSQKKLENDKTSVSQKKTVNATNKKLEILGSNKTAGQNIIQTKNITKANEGKVVTQLNKKDETQLNKKEETKSQEKKLEAETPNPTEQRLEANTTTEINKTSRDPRCRPKTQTDNKETEKLNEKDKTESQVKETNDSSPILSNIIITSFEKEVTLKPQTNKAAENSLSSEEKNKAALEKFNKATQEMSPKPQRILRRRNTMVLFGSAPIVDKEKLLNANALLFEDIQEQAKRKRKQEEEDRQNARRNRHLEEMFQRTDDNCTVSTQNIITGKRRTRATINFNETVVAMNVFKHISKKDSVTGPTPANTTTTPSTTTAAPIAKTTKNSSKAKTKALDSKTKAQDNEKDCEQEETTNIETKSTKTTRQQLTKDGIKKENLKDLEDTNEISENEPSTSKNIIKPNKKKAGNNRKSLKDSALNPISQDEEHQNCAVSSTSAEAPNDEQPKASSSKTYKNEPDDNEPTSTASKINNSTPTPEASLDVLNDIVQQIIKPNADRQHILGLLGQILSEDRLEFIKTIIENTTKQQTDTTDKESSKSTEQLEASDKAINKKEQHEKEAEEDEQEEEDEEKEEEEQEHIKASTSNLTKRQQKKTKPLVAKKKRNELDRLNEDIRDMFICEGVLTATGRRMCTIMGQPTLSNDNETPNKKSTKEISPSETSTAKRKVNKTNVEKSKSTPLRRSLRSCRTNEEGDDHDETLEDNSSLKSTTESSEDFNSTTDSNTTDSTPRRKMPLLKPNTPIKLSEEENPSKELVAKEKPLPVNKRKQANKPCPKSKKPKNATNIEEDSRDITDTESELEAQSVTQDQDRNNDEDEPFKIRNTNIHWHNQSKYINWCVICNKRIPAKTSAFHYNCHHGENYISRLAPVLLQKFKQGKLNQPLFGVDRSPKQASWFFRCPFCLQYLNTTMPLWLEHLQNHTAEFRYECSRCHRGSNKAVIIRKHISSQCKGAIMTNSVVKLSVPTLIKAHVCHLCNFMQLKRVNLERHYLEQHQLDRKNVDLLGYTITLFDVENVKCVAEDKAAEKEDEVRKVIENEEQVIDILDDDEESAEVSGKEKSTDRELEAQKEKTNEAIETQQEEEEIIANSATQKESEDNLAIKVKKEKTVKPKEVTAKVSDKQKVNPIEKVVVNTENQKLNEVTAQESEKEASVNTNGQKEHLNQTEKDETQKEHTLQREQDKPQKENSTEKEKDTEPQKENNEEPTTSSANDPTEKSLDVLNFKQKAFAVVVVDIRKEKTKSTKNDIVEEPLAAAKTQSEKEVPKAKQEEVPKEKLPNEAKHLKQDNKKKLNSKSKKDKDDKLQLEKEIPMIDLVIIEDNEAQDIQDELLVLAAQAAAQEEEQTKENQTEIQPQLVDEDDEVAKTHNDLLELASKVTEEQRNLATKQTPITATSSQNPDQSNTFAQETHATISDLISSSIDRIYKRSKRKSSDVFETVEAKKSCLPPHLATSNVFMSTTTRDDNNSSPTIQILAQSIINIEEQAKQTETSSDKTVAISMAERLSQRFKGLQDRATNETDPKKPRENPFEKLFNDTVLELEKEKDKMEATTQKETQNETPLASIANDITVISDDEDWEDIEITETAPTASSSAGNTGNLQKSKNKGLFQKFGLYKGNNTKTKKMPPLVYLPIKKKTKEKAASLLTNTTSSSPTPAPTPSLKQTTTLSTHEKSPLTSTSTTVNNDNINLVGFKPVINIMDDLLPDSPCNDPIDLVPELANFEPLQDLNDVSSILDSNLSVSIDVDDHHTSMEDALDFISEQQAQDKQLTISDSNLQTQTKVITNNIQHVGYSVQTSGANAFKFYCLLENCSFLYSSDALGLENHFLCEHSHIKWNGYCLMCQTQCLPNNETSVDFSISKEIKHMLEKHANKLQLDLHTESTQHSTTSSHESEDRPKIKLRRLTGDCLSTANSDNSTSLDLPTNLATNNAPLTMLGALLNAKPKPPTKDMPPQPQMPLTEPLLLDKNDVGASSSTPFKNVSQDFLITSVTSAATQKNDSPLQISSIISLKQQSAALANAAPASTHVPIITNVRTLASKVGNSWSQQLVDERQELMEAAAESLEVSSILANAGRPSISREPVRALDDSPGPVVVAETVPVAQGTSGDYVITQTISAQYNENSSTALGFNISIAANTATSSSSGQESIPTDVSTPITSRQYKCMASSCKFVSRVPVAMSDHLRFHERRNLSNKHDYLACAFCSYLASSVDDYMKHTDHYHIINKTVTTTGSNEVVDTANSLTKKIQDILNHSKTNKGGTTSSRVNEASRNLVSNSRGAEASNQNQPEQESEEVYLRKLRQTVDEIVESTGLTDDKLYRCVVKNCNTKLTEAKFLSHIMFHIGAEGGNPNNYNFKCPHCSAQYQRVAGIKAHIKNHAVNRFFCYMCEQTSANPAQMLKHFSENHWHTLNMFTRVLLEPIVSSDGSDEVLDSGFFVAYTTKLTDEEVKEFGKRLILQWQRKKSGSKTHFKSTEIDLLPGMAIFQRVVNCGECEYSTKVRTNMLRHLSMHKQNPDLANNSGQSKLASVDPVNPVPCLNSSERFFDKMTNLSSSSLIPSLTSNAQTNVKSNFIINYSFVMLNKRLTCGCPNCSFVALSEDVFRQHIAVIHNDQISFRCTFCQEDVCKKGLAIDRILNHLRFHGATIYRCEECNYLHHIRYVVERHINEKHATQKVNLVTHERSSEDDAEGSTSKTVYTGKKYKDNLDSNQQPQSSTSATATRSSNSESSSTKSTNVTKGKGKWICDLCGHKSTTLAQIQTHSQQQHGSKNQYKCTHCSFGSQQLSQILFHIDEKHSSKTREARCMYHKAVNANDDVADTRPLWQRNDPTRVRHIRGILMEDEEESEEYRKKLGLSDDINDDDDDDNVDDAAENEGEETEELDVTTIDYLLGYEFSCFHCNYKTQNFNDLKLQHYQNVHNSVQETALPFWYQLYRRFCCAVCRQFMGNFIELKKHLTYSHKDNRYYAADITIAENDDYSHRLLCGYCSHHCATVEQLYKHTSRVQHAQSDLRIHNNDHIMDILKLGKFETSYQCTLCTDIFPNSVAIVQHACNAHPGEDSFSFRELSNSLIYRCFQCSYTSTSEIDVLRHMIDHYSRFKHCHFCPDRQTTFIAYMQHCYAEHRSHIRKFREIYPIAELQKFLLNILIVFPSGLMISKIHLLNTKYGKTLAIEELYEDIHKISEQPPIPRLLIGRLVARKSIEAQQKHRSTSPTSPPAFLIERQELIKPIPTQAKKISKRRGTVAVSQNDNTALLTNNPKSQKLMQKPKPIAQRRQTVTLERDNLSFVIASGIENTEFNIPAMQPKKISKRRRTVAVDVETPAHPFSTSPYPLLIAKELTSKKRKTSSSTPPPPPAYPSNLDVEPFSYYGQTPEAFDISKVFTNFDITGTLTALTLDQLKNVLNIDCQLKLTKCDQEVQMLDYKEYKHINKACPASHKIRYN